MPGTIIVSHAIDQTWIVAAVLLIALLFFKPIEYREVLPMGATQELKGVAILAVVFGHIGYFLVDDNRFLFPLSTGAGIGVDIFLFLSGYGLTLGLSKKSLTLPAFYRKRVLKIFIPLWIALLIFFTLDACALHRYYGAMYIARSLFGFFPSADMAGDVDSVLWYITWTLFYYVLFPLVFMRRRVWISALLLFAFGEALMRWHPAMLEPVIHLYQLHTAAFPLGMLSAALLFEDDGHRNALANAVRERRKYLGTSSHVAVLLALIALAIYSLYDSGVGEGVLKPQVMSLTAALAIVALFAFKRVELPVLKTTGNFSYEIYLLHWPLMSRYDFLYRHVKAAAATLAYLALFIGLGWLMRLCTRAAERRLDREPALRVESSHKF